VGFFLPEGAPSGPAVTDCQAAGRGGIDEQADVDLDSSNIKTFYWPCASLELMNNILHLPAASQEDANKVDRGAEIVSFCF